MLSCLTYMHVYAHMQDVRRKVARVVAAKCTLAARVDSFHESPSGEVGQGMYIVYTLVHAFVCSAGIKKIL